MTSGTRVAVCRQRCGQAKVTSSMNGRCGSRPDWSVPVSSVSSAREPTTGEVVLLAAPDRQRGAPVAVAGQRPVDVVVQPVAEAAVLDRVREPVGLLVLLEQAVLDGGGADVPGRLRVVEQRGVAAPAVRVAVLVRDVPEEQAARVEVLGERLVGLLEEDAADERDVLLEGAVGADRVHDRQAVGAADLEVVLTEGGGLVDQARAVLGGDVLGVDHVVGGRPGNSTSSNGRW